MPLDCLKQSSMTKKKLLNFAALPMTEMWLMRSRCKKLNVSLFDKWDLISFSPAEMYRIQFFLPPVLRCIGQTLVNPFLNENIPHAYLVMNHNVKIPGLFQACLERNILYIYVYTFIFWRELSSNHLLMYFCKFFIWNHKSAKCQRHIKNTGTTYCLSCA